jgi:hypothetical protein
MNIGVTVYLGEAIEDQRRHHLSYAHSHYSNAFYDRLWFYIVYNTNLKESTGSELTVC